MKIKTSEDVCVLENYIHVFNFGNKLLKYSEDILKNIEEEQKISALLIEDKDFIECKNKCENINTIMICIHGTLKDVNNAEFHKEGAVFKIPLDVLAFFVHYLIYYRTEINIILSMCYSARTEDYFENHSHFDKLSEYILKTSFSYKFTSMLVELAISKSLSLKNLHVSAVTGALSYHYPSGHSIVQIEESIMAAIKLAKVKDYYIDEMKKYKNKDSNKIKKYFEKIKPFIRNSFLRDKKINQIAIIDEVKKTLEIRNESEISFCKAFIELELLKLISDEELAEKKYGEISFNFIKNQSNTWVESVEQKYNSNKKILEKPYVPNYKYNYTELHRAVIKGNFDRTKYFLDKMKHDDIYKPVEREKLTVVHLAVEKNNLEMIELLLNYDKNFIKLIDERGYTALHYAIVLIMYTKESIFKKLIECSNKLKTIGLSDKTGQTVLHLLAGAAAINESQRIRIAKILIEKIEHDDIFKQAMKYSNYTALHIAVLHGDDSIGNNLCLMSKIGKDGPESGNIYLEIKDNKIKYRTSLIQNNEVIVLEKNDFLQDSKLYEEIYLKIEQNQLENVSLASKAKLLEIIFKRGHTHSILDFIDILLKHGGEKLVSMRDENGLTALDIAIQCKKINMVEALVKKIAPYEILTPIESSPFGVFYHRSSLEFAIQSKDESIIQTIIKNSPLYSVTTELNKTGMNPCQY